MDPNQRRVTSLPVYTVADGDTFAMLPAEERAALEQKIKYTEYSAEYPFYSPEDTGEKIYVLRRGRVRLYKLSPEGRTLTLLILEPLAIFGEMALAEHWRHDSFAEAMTDCLVGTVRRDIVRRVLDAHPPVALRFMEVMSSRLHAMERKLADIAFKSVPQRLATVLLSLAATSPQADGTPPVVVRYTHLQLAEMIGSYRETVTKVVGEFREAGLIRIEEETIHLTDLARLHELVGSNSRL